MGQTITTTVREGSSPSVRIFELNRSLTGMDTERYSTAEEAEARGDRPPDVLAARLIRAGALGVAISSNVVIVEAPAADWPTLGEQARYLVEHLFEYYGDDAGWSHEALGLEPPPPVDLTTPTG